MTLQAVVRLEIEPPDGRDAQEVATAIRRALTVDGSGITVQTVIIRTKPSRRPALADA